MGCGGQYAVTGGISMMLKLCVGNLDMMDVSMNYHSCFFVMANILSSISKNDHKKNIVVSMSMCAYTKGPT